MRGVAETKHVQKSFGRIDQHVRKILRRTGYPGLSIALTDRRRTLWLRTYGYSELESKTRVKPDTLFQIGSISKFFTSLILMQLREEGLVDLARPLTAYLPWFQVKTKYGAITLHHLLTHTSGMIIGQEESPAGIPSVWALRDTETGAAPGQYFHYSNHGYKAIGLVLERITGEPYGSLITTRLLRPLAMNSTEAVITNEMRSRLAVGYAPFYEDRPFSLGGRLAPAVWFESGTADGTICSTPEDMCRFIRMLLNRGECPRGRVVSRESFDLMAYPHVKPEDSTHGESYGYGMNVGKYDGHPCLWHGGGMPGFNTSIIADMENGLGVVTMINGPGTPEDVSLLAMRTMWAARSGAKAPALRVPQRFHVERPQQYEGSYRSGETVLRITASKDGLWLMSGRARNRLEPMGSDRFYSRAKGMDLFLFRFGRRDGKVVELFHGPDWYVNASYHGPRDYPTREDWQSLVGHYCATAIYASNFRIVLRKGALSLIDPGDGDPEEEQPLIPLDDGSFRIGVDPRCPERIRFDMLIDGQAHLAVRSGARYYRTFTP